MAFKNGAGVMVAGGGGRVCGALHGAGAVVTETSCVNGAGVSHELAAPEDAFHSGLSRFSHLFH